MRRVFSFLIGATIGGLIGAVLALLFAPSSGTELRAQISNRAQLLQLIFARQLARNGLNCRIVLRFCAPPGPDKKTRHICNYFFDITFL